MPLVERARIIRRSTETDRPTSMARTAPAKVDKVVRGAAARASRKIRGSRAATRERPESPRLISSHESMLGSRCRSPKPPWSRQASPRLWQSPGLSGRFGGVNVSVQGDTVTLRGIVTSENDRLLAAQMAMLEPSVSSVRNELTVAVPTANPPR